MTIKAEDKTNSENGLFHNGRSDARLTIVGRIHDGRIVYSVRIDLSSRDDQLNMAEENRDEQ